MKGERGVVDEIACFGVNNEGKCDFLGLKMMFFEVFCRKNEKSLCYLLQV